MSGRNIHLVFFKEFKMASELGIIMKTLNIVEDTIDDFDDILSSEVDDMIEDYEDGTVQDLQHLDFKEIAGSILISMILPSLVVASSILFLWVLMTSLKRYSLLNKWQDAVLSKKYRDLKNVITLDPEKLDLPKKEVNGGFLTFTARVLLTLALVVLVFAVFLGHFSTWNKWGANIDSRVDFTIENPLSIRDIHIAMMETLSFVTKEMEEIEARVN